MNESYSLILGREGRHSLRNRRMDLSESLTLLDWQIPKAESLTMHETTSSLVLAAMLMYHNYGYEFDSATDMVVDLPASLHKELSQIRTLYDLNTFIEQSLSDESHPCHSCKRNVEEIRDTLVAMSSDTEAITHQARLDLVKMLDAKQKHLSCACCGEKYMEQEIAFHGLKLPKLVRLRLSSLVRLTIAEFNELPWEAKVIRSVFPSFHDDQTAVRRFHLHPEFVRVRSAIDLNARNKRLQETDYEADVCDRCWKSMKKGKIPKLSLADGHDYGV